MTRWVVHSSTQFEARHALLSYLGEPEESHSHQWQVAVRVGTDRLHQEGYAVDFHAVHGVLGGIKKDLEGTGAFVIEIETVDHVGAGAAVCQTGVGGVAGAAGAAEPHQGDDITDACAAAERGIAHARRQWGRQTQQCQIVIHRGISQAGERTMGESFRHGERTVIRKLKGASP